MSESMLQREAVWKLLDSRPTVGKPFLFNSGQASNTTMTRDIDTGGYKEQLQLLN